MSLRTDVRRRLKLNTKLKTSEERLSLVEELLQEEMITKAQATYLADYLLFVADSRQTGKERQEEYPIVTKNRDVTVSKRQVSFEETVDSLSNGEDGIYSMIINDKNALLDMRAPITEEDKQNIPGIAENLEVIDSLKKQLEEAHGRRKYFLKCQIISKYQELYTLKSSRLGRAKVPPQVHTLATLPLDEHITVNEKGVPVSDGLVSLMRKDNVFFLLEYYQVLKQDTYDNFSSDMHYMLLDLERAVDKALVNEPVLYDLLVWKIDGCTGAEIVEKMREKHGIDHTEQYYSVVWHSKIPKLVCEAAQKRWLVWHYTFEAPKEAHWKICNTCGKMKLASPYFFNRNTSKDGYYSMCKCCRAKKHKEEKNKKVSKNA